MEKEEGGREGERVVCLVVAVPPLSSFGVYT